MGSSKIKTVDMSQPIDDPKTKDTLTTEGSEEKTEVTKPRKIRTRSKKYTHRRSQVDKTTNYELKKAIELVQKLSSAKHPTITADINCKDDSYTGEIKFPHSTGKTVNVVIADEKLLKKIEKGEINFDVLLAKPEMMPKIAKLARVLGPKGLMPNPKNKTVTPDPESRKKELEGGKITLKTEKKGPLLHVQIGSTTQPVKEISDNITHLVKSIGAGKIARLTISSTMSPGVKIDLSSFVSAN